MSGKRCDGWWRLVQMSILSPEDNCLHSKEGVKVKLVDGQSLKVRLWANSGERGVSNVVRLRRYGCDCVISLEGKYYSCAKVSCMYIADSQPIILHQHGESQSSLKRASINQTIGV